jgi:hypothetical protein
MSDDLEFIPTRRVEVSARFIRQAYEHIEATKDHHVILLFSGLQNDQEITCVGISTRRLFTEQLSSEPAMPNAARPVTEAPGGPWSMETLTDDVVLAIVNEHGPINTTTVAEMLGIPSEVTNLRQKIRRIMERLVKQRQLRQSGSGRSQTFSKREPARMSVRAASGRKLSRSDITEERVVDVMQQAGGPISSRTIGDMLQIPRNDALVRSKITLVIAALRDAGRVKIAGNEPGHGGRLYAMAGRRNAEAE